MTTVGYVKEQPLPQFQDFLACIDPFWSEVDKLTYEEMEKRIVEINACNSTPAYI